MKKKIYFASYIILSALSIALCAIFTGCSRSETDSGEPDIPDVPSGVEVPVRITLSALPNNAQTRADEGKPKDPDASVELIHDWWIAFIDNNGTAKKVKVITQNDVKDKTQSTSVNIPPDGGFEAETFRTTLPAGTYRIYAFANIPSKSAGDIESMLELEKGKYKFKDKYISDFVSDPNFGDGVMQWPDDKNIPMTAVLDDHTIKNTVEEALNIEVIRAVAKVQFAFHKPNPNDNISLKELQFSPISNGKKISIVPSNECIGIKLNDKIFKDMGNGKNNGTLTFSNPGTLSLTQDPTSKYNMGMFSFYCKESLPAIDGGPFTIKLTVNKNGMEQERTFQTTKITYINRNDWIYIPIKFNDWEIIWKLHYYPPIGGYPPVFKQSGSGNTLTATLTTGGEFELYPYKIKKNSEEADYFNDVDWDNVTISALTDDEKRLFVDGKTPTVMDNPNISTENHPLNGRPKIIAGELKSTEKGKAEIKITFYLNNTDSDNNTIPYAKTEFDCTFTIYRENSSQ